MFLENVSRSVISQKIELFEVLVVRTEHQHGTIAIAKIGLIVCGVPFPSLIARTDFGFLLPISIPRMLLLMSPKANTMAPVDAPVTLAILTVIPHGTASHASLRKTCTDVYASVRLDSIRLLNFLQENLRQCILFCGIQAVNTRIQINQSNCLQWFELITATCFGPHLGPSSGSFIKYVSCYWNIQIWIHISVDHCNHIIFVTITKLELLGFWTFFHRLVFYRTRRFGKWICFRPRVKVGEKTPTQLGPLEWGQ
jgi:hypothetical protein